MNTSLGYSKKTLTDSNVLLSGGGDKALSEFIGSLNWDSTNKKLQYKSASSTNFTDLITFGSNAFTSYSGYNIVFLNNEGTTVDTFKALTSPSKTLKAGTNVQMTAASNVITITATDTTYSVFTGASSSAAGSTGLVKLPSAGDLTKFLRGDSTWQTINLNVTSALYVGASNGTGNSAQSTNGNVYLIFAEGSSYSRYKIVGSGRASVTSDANGNITINSSGYSNFGVATASAAGSAGLVPAPGKNVLGSAGYYLRADGTWQKPPNDNTWNAANASQAGYVPKSIANKILRADGNGALYWGDDSNDHYRTYLYVGSSQGGSNTALNNPYLKIFDNTTYTNQVQFVAGTGISIASNTSGQITITNSSPDVNHNTDSATSQTDNNENAERPILLKNGTGTGTVTSGTLFADGVTVNPSTNSLSVSGNLSVTGTSSFSNNVTISGEIINKVDKATEENTVVISGSSLASTQSDQASFRSALNATRSYIGSTSGWNSWQNVISCRHRNGSGDGNVYGMYIRTHLTATSDNLYWDREHGGTWQGERTIIDSGNISSQSVNYATSAGNADTVDNLHASNLVRFFLSPLSSNGPADSAKSWFTGTMPSASGAIVYNVPGSEKTIIAGKSSGACGHMLQLNYDDTYLRILRYSAGSWQSTDWEKISAGYADSASNLLDSNNSSKTITASYHSGGYTSSPAYLTAWNGYHLTYCEPKYVTGIGSAAKLTTARSIWGLSFDGTGDISSHLYLGGYLFMLFGGEWLSTIDNDSNGPIFGYLLAIKNRRTYYTGSPVYICGGSYSNYASGITVNASNNVGIGTTSPSLKLDVSGIINCTGLFVINDSSNNTYDGLAYFRTYSGNDWGVIIDKNNAYDYGLDIRCNGDYGLRCSGHARFSNNVYAVNFYTTSDRSKKQNISSFSEHIRKFQLKDTEKWHYGVIALEVPEMFRDGEEGNMTVNYNSVLSYYVGCLENKVKELEEKIKVLETKLNKLI